MITGGDWDTVYQDYFEATGLISHNIIAGNEGHGIYIGHNTPGLDGNDRARLKIFNNTFYDNGRVTGYSTFYAETSMGYEFINNIVYVTSAPFFQDVSGYSAIPVSYNNLYYSESGPGSWAWKSQVYTSTPYTYGTVQNENGSIVDDLRLIDPAGGRFDIDSFTAVSPALNAGLTVDLQDPDPADFCGQAVPDVISGLPDIGAFEGICGDYILKDMFCADNDGDGYYTGGSPCGNQDVNDADSEVYSYSVGDFHAPINQDGTSRYKIGRVIPVKVTVFDNRGLPVPGETVRIAVITGIGNDEGTVEENVEAAGSANTDNFFRDDDDDGTYMYNLDTSNYIEGAYSIKATLESGESKSVEIFFREY